VPRTYRSDRRAEQAARTRQRVLAAATELFEGQGYAATTVRAVASDAGVSVQTVELAFGSKPRLLKACIDVAIAGDDEPVPVLEREWTEAVRAATSPEELLSAVSRVVGPAQERSAGLVLAVFEGASSDVGLARLSDQMADQRRGTATWVVRELQRTSRLRGTERESVDSLWTLMDPAVHVRLVRTLGWTRTRYEHWFATSAEHLLVPDRQEKAP
jgi:TetR/AcrR family transcriptional regulator of autoinduction and epiphytic fitness